MRVLKVWWQQNLKLRLCWSSRLEEVLCSTNKGRPPTCTPTDPPTDTHTHTHQHLQKDIVTLQLCPVEAGICSPSDECVQQYIKPSQLCFVPLTFFTVQICSKLFFCTSVNIVLSQILT
ncbi:hypothetical protein FQA47_001462 [Oryzias melastigma]|uniref:Uncharacterized protein n=1 Tax=Oryzias melastigma TaxID=30732 RepID=A0A834FRG0_ORYME|nr:hypothetical protein FQA47_001462 [Oryzias melastigma]